MKKPILIILALTINSLIFSQEKIHFDYSKDYDSILKLTKDSNSKIFYNDLIERFEKADSTLTNYELVALQIGYTDNPKYWPYQDISLEREIWSLNEKSEFELSEKKLDTLLSNNPFNILGHREMSYVQSKLGNKEKTDLHYKKFELIVASILSTGDGTSYETSCFTLSPADGQWIIKLAFRQEICSMASGRDDNGNFHDILGVKLEGSEDCRQLYFNIEPASNRMFGPEGLKLDKTKGKIEIGKDGKVILKKDKKSKKTKN